MAYITDYGYYLNSGTAPLSKNLGSYQYVPLNDIVDNFILTRTGEDTMLNNVKKYLIRFHAKSAIKELNYDAVNSVRAIEVQVDSSLKLKFPHDFVNWVRVSMEKNGVLYPLSENRKIMGVDAYLLDSSDNLTFDSEGQVLTATSELELERQAASSTQTDPAYCTQYTFGANYALATEDANSNPRFKVDKRKGVIDFDSRISGELVVLEYISDGMENGNDDLIGIEKGFEQFVYAYITKEILSNKPNISDVTMRRANKKASSLLKNAKIRASGIHPARLLQEMRGKDNWIK